MMNKKRIAILTSGSVGTGFNSEGIPHHAVLIEKLADIYDLTVYSFAKLNDGFVGKNYTFVDVSFLGNHRLFFRFLYLFLQILHNHFKSPYHLFLGFWGFPGGFLSVLMGKILLKPKVVAFIGGEVVSIPEINYGEFHKKWFRKLLNFTANNADTLLVLSKYQINQIKESGITYKQAQVIPFGVDTQKFKFIDHQITHPLKMIHVASLNLVKNQETLLKAFKKINQKVDAHLTIIGFDTLNGKVQKFANEMGLANNTSFLGRVPYQKLPEYFAKSRIFLLSSLSESQAVVVSEAMSCGLVVAGTRVGMIADLEDFCTVAVDTKDADALAQKVISLLDNPKQYADYQSKGLAWSRKHDIDWTVNKYKELFDSLIKS